MIVSELMLLSIHSHVTFCLRMDYLQKGRTFRIGSYYIRYRVVVRL